MAEKTRKVGLEMPDVPDPGFVDALCEIWSGIGYAAYHSAYVRVYVQTAALRASPKVIGSIDQRTRNLMQTDTLICRAHLAAFFWQLDHIFEALRLAITRGQKEQATLKHFWQWEKALDTIEQDAFRKEISAYRNQGHQYPAIIGCQWDGDHKLVRHFLPRIEGLESREDIDISDMLQRYFEYVVNVWLRFAPGDFKEKFPRDFSFPVTVPFTFVGELPARLESAPQLSVEIVAFDIPNADEKAAERN
jgi:hypothetical protein